MMRNALSGLLLGAAFGAAGLFAVYQGGSLAWHLWGTVAAVVLVTAWGALGLGAFQVRRDIPEGPFRVGDAVPVALEVIRPRGVWGGLELTDLADDGSVRFHAAWVAGWRRRSRFQYQVPATRRGLLRFLEVRLQNGDVFGMFRRQRYLDASGECLVWPRTVPLMRGRGWLESPGQPGSSVLGVRDYVAGDPWSHIHWKLSARTGRLQTRQFGPGEDPWWIALDAGAGMSGETWELAISVAASLWEWVHAEGWPSGLLSTDAGSGRIEPGVGASHLGRGMEWLSRLPEEPGSSGSAAFLPTGTLLVTNRERGTMFEGAALTVIPVGASGIEVLEALPEWLQLRQGGGRRHG